MQKGSLQGHLPFCLGDISFVQYLLESFHVYLIISLTLSFLQAVLLILQGYFKMGKYWFLGTLLSEETKEILALHHHVNTATYAVGKVWPGGHKRPTGSFALVKKFLCPFLPLEVID